MLIEHFALSVDGIVILRCWTWFGGDVVQNNMYSKISFFSFSVLKCEMVACIHCQVDTLYAIVFAFADEMLNKQYHHNSCTICMDYGGDDFRWTALKLQSVTTPWWWWFISFNSIWNCINHFVDWRLAGINLSKRNLHLDTFSSSSSNGIIKWP